MKTNRLPALDALRGVLALFVVLHHVASGFGIMSLIQPARWAVLTFFVMSGFVLARSYDGRPLAFLLRRAVRLWPLYALTMLAGGVVIGVMPDPTSLFWYPMLPLTGVPKADPSAWTLYYEAWATPLLLVAFALARSRAIACMLAPLSLGLVFIDARFSCAPFFVLGVAAAQFDIPLPRCAPAWTLWLGKISFSLYLTHQVVLTAADQIGGPWEQLTALPIVFLVAWLAWRYVEVPSITMSRAVGRLSLGSSQTVAVS